MHKDIVIIDTGGTFSKKYQRRNGEFDIKSNVIKKILKKWLAPEYKVIPLLSKDSIFFTDKDRELILETIQQQKSKNIIIVHGTDTMSITANFLKSKRLDYTIVLTGAMVPYTISKTEASANLGLAIGAIGFIKSGVYIAMNGLIKESTEILKDYKKGNFKMKETECH